MEMTHRESIAAADIALKRTLKAVRKGDIGAWFCGYTRANGADAPVAAGGKPAQVWLMIVVLFVQIAKISGRSLDDLFVDFRIAVDIENNGLKKG